MRDHGTRARYVGDKCRCAPCTEANRAYVARAKKSVAPPYVDAKRARAHVTHLMAEGFGLKAQAKAAGVSETMLSKVVYGDPRRGQALTKRIRPDNEKAILGLTLHDAPDHARTVHAAQYTATLAQLHERGWTYTQIADAIGTGVSNLRPKGDRAMVTAGRHRAVLALLDQDPPPIGADETGHLAAARARRDAYDPEAERRDRLRKAANAEARAHYWALERQTDDAPPVLDIAALAAQEWRDWSACRFVPDDERWIFWAPEADQRAMDACRQVCSWCPVADQCLTEALRSGETGFWGGHTEAERQTMRTAAA